MILASDLNLASFVVFIEGVNLTIVTDSDMWFLFLLTNVLIVSR